MTLDEFRATGVDVDDLGAALHDSSLVGEPGRIYCGGLYINPRPEGWILIIYRDSWVEPLPALEERLYQFAIDEGWIVTLADD